MKIAFIKHKGALHFQFLYLYTCKHTTIEQVCLVKMLSLPPCAESMPVVMVTENMVRGLDEDESSFLDEVSRQQCLVEKQRRDEEKQELLEYRISFFKSLNVLDIKIPPLPSALCLHTSPRASLAVSFAIRRRFPMCDPNGVAV